MNLSARALSFVAVAGVVAPLAFFGSSKASDHADTPEIAANPGTDITDVYLFPSTPNPNKVVMSMSVHPLIAKGQGRRVYFDPNVLYQFKIDNTGDAVEDLVIQARFGPAGPTQSVMISGPVAPSMTGSLNAQEPALGATGTVNATFLTAPDVRVYAGGREDSFFFDLERFFAILPDRATPLSGPIAINPNKPQLGSWRPAGEAVDFLSNGNFNVLSIVVELPRTMLKGTGNGVISLWTTTSVPSGGNWAQRDRLARPVVNEVFATVDGDRHKINDEISPKDDAEELRYDILGFMTYPAHRSAAIREVIAAVLVPDVLKADLTKFDGASYLGYETGGATGSQFGGRKLSDDVVDISLGVVFGGIIPALGLAPDDGREIPSLTSDNVGAGGKHFLNFFPYLGNPR